MGANVCLSDVMFLPYLKDLPQQYFQSYFIGIGVGQALPMVLAITQGAATYDCVPKNATDPDSPLEPVFTSRFGVEVYYSVVFVFYAIGILSFVLLSIKKKNLKKDGSIKSTTRVTKKDCDLPAFQFKSRQDVMLVLMNMTMCAQLYVFVPSITPYAVLPYSKETYYYTNILSCLCGPLGALMARAMPTRDIKKVFLWYLVVISLSSFNVLLAFQSPKPILVGTFVGSVMIVSCQCLMWLIGFYVYSMLIEIVRETAPAEHITERRLIYSGLISQLGSFIGTVTVFVSVNMLELFKEVPPC
ncbi:unnamed protein product [Bursaphelenchus okinawaensis]|uniref:Riboflavin transporter n=1 Tax=Bursaphelenchus okinawaensis TaxID=465554 RepID=A0A811KZ51_9BILA|nr:unnamed protein product [Bursaphelenchus okinawaensis]CAG9114079.1 unnamed protein product [Bursaphelenchus okinawaensis]